MNKRQKISTIEDILDGEKIQISGRIINLNKKSKEKCFIFLKDQSGYISVTVDVDLIDDDFKIGDLLSIYGQVQTYKNGNKGFLAEKIQLISSSKGSTFNKDYFQKVSNRLNTPLYSLFSIEGFENVKKRSSLIKTIRNILDNEGFMEIDTPILNLKTTSSSAKPFSSYWNAKKKDVFLRKSIEQKLKEFVIAGFENIYEIGKVFRNEGISKRYLPEYTAVDILSAYTSLEYIIYLSEEILKKASLYFTKIQSAERYSFNEILNKFNYEKSNESLSDFKYFKKNIEPMLKEPTIIYNFPAELSPSAIKNGTEAEDFKIYLNGYVVMHGYSLETNKELLSNIELNQIKKRGHSPEDYDLSFQEMLKYGMPPTYGVGFSVERLMLALSKTKDIREYTNCPLK